MAALIGDIHRIRPTMETTNVETEETTPREQEMAIQREETASPPKPELASIREVFSFARSPQTRWRIALACCSAAISGSVFPGK
jgi:hypothetical protein